MNLREIKQVFLIHQSGCFDRTYYLRTYPDVRRADIDPILHYVRTGWKEGRNPNSGFNTQNYLANHPDLLLAGLNPLLHSIQEDQIIRSFPKDLRDDIRCLDNLYLRNFGRKIDFTNPRTLTEKLQLYKLFYRNPLLTQLADKYRVREYISEKVGSQYLIPLLGVYENADQIPFESLPDQFVIKPNHGSGWFVLSENKNELDWPAEKQRINQWMQQNFYWNLREWAYKDIKPLILVEKYLFTPDGKKPEEIKVTCINSVPRFIGNYFHTNHGRQVIYFDTNWEFAGFRTAVDFYPDSVLRPAQLDDILHIAQRLSAEFPFVRVDFYIPPGQLFCGEMTFYPVAGFTHYDPPEWDEKFGSWFDISEFYPPS